MKKVLFVCIHNSGRSQMAEAFFNHFAQGGAIAYSAGTQPEPEISPKTITLMREEGIELDGHKPELLTPEMLAEADRVITMGCDVAEACPSLLIDAEDWALGNPKGRPMEELGKTRGEIKARVQALVKELLPA
jgi:arsenate reductase